MLMSTSGSNVRCRLGLVGRRLGVVKRRLGVVKFFSRLSTFMGSVVVSLGSMVVTSGLVVISVWGSMSVSLLRPSAILFLRLVVISLWSMIISFLRSVVVMGGTIRRTKSVSTPLEQLAQSWHTWRGGAGRGEARRGEAR
jgi:hypothetical protein